jgi:hypothetical protein
VRAGGTVRLRARGAYRHARHYIGCARDVDARIAEHLAGSGSSLVRAAVAAGVRVTPARSPSAHAAA